jgi:hypothetical protein
MKQEEIAKMIEIMPIKRKRPDPLFLALALDIFREKMARLERFELPTLGTGILVFSEYYF